MRVIAGTAKRLKLKAPDGMETRPTTDRIKETLFNMLAPDLYDCRFLDLFAGSGGIGIEALSRGAAEAVFVEKNPKAMSCIKENLAYTKLEKRAITIQADALSALARMEDRKQFDFIFMDPPYLKDWEKRVLQCLADRSLLSDGGMIIVEAVKETSLDYAGDLGFSIIKEKLYKTNKHVFLKRKERVC